MQPSRLVNAQWLHRCCQRTLPRLGLELEVIGCPPDRGLIVSNHLSYLDILAYSATLPCVFVSKAEVSRWTVIGHFATQAGTIYVRREKKGDAARANASIAQCLQLGVPVVLFPEGTTTNGENVLRFHATMLQPALDAGVTITPCAIRYWLEDGEAANEVCWWGGMTLLPHVLNLFRKREIRATILFGEAMQPSVDRKTTAARLHEEVARLRQQVVRFHASSSENASVMAKAKAPVSPVLSDRSPRFDR